METTAARRPPALSARPYDFDHPRLFPDVLNDLHVGKDDLGPGDDIGTFDLPTTQGGRFRSSDLREGGRPVLLVFGSQTCPITESAAPGLKRLHETYGHLVRFVMLAVREAHPGASIPQPHTADEKARHAAALRSHHALPFEVAIDALDGTLHRRLGSRPSSAYLVEPSGKIAFRAQWANETEAIGEALEAVASGRTPRRPAVTRTLPAIAKAMGFASPVHDAAGKGARFDTWRIAPPLGAMMVLSELLFFLPRETRGGAAMALMMGGGLAFAAALVAALS
jgi:thiol-disulfide isomerase/thioredoxin